MEVSINLACAVELAYVPDDMYPIVQLKILQPYTPYGSNCTTCSEVNNATSSMGIIGGWQPMWQMYTGMNTKGQR